MNRCLAMMCALLFAFVSVSSACMAAPSEWIDFDLKAQRDHREIHATFNDERHGRDQNHWSNGFKPSELIGLNMNGFYTAGSRPLRFAIVREAGRLDCAGTGGSAHAWGNCGFTPDAAFLQLLASRGIGRPDREQAFGLMAVDARRELIEALAVAHYPTPSIVDLTALSALEVTDKYISQMAHAGYRPATLDTLIQFKALEITPEWIAGFVRIGYANLSDDELVPLKALEISPEFIAEFDRIGYPHLPVDQLVQLKALDITPEFVQRIVAVDQGKPSIDKLVQIKTFGDRR